MTRIACRVPASQHTAFALVLVLIAVLAIGCSGSRATSFERFTGTEGLVVEFGQGAPPPIVEEGLPFSVSLVVRNKGAIDIPYDRIRILFSADPLYIAGGVVQLTPGEGFTDGALLHGRSLAYPTGEEARFTVPGAYAFRANTVLGTLEHPKTTLAATLCAPYTTVFAESVCIDTTGFEENLRAQPCDPEDLSDSGQGAPIAVTLVEVDAYPAIDSLTGEANVQPVFTIHLRDLHAGLIGPDTLPPETACLRSGIPQEELSTARIEAWLLGTELTCTPTNPRFVEGEAEARCTVAAGGAGTFGNTQNFMTTLMVNVSYLYASKLTAPIEIRRAHVQSPGGFGGKIDGYVYDGAVLRLGPDGQPMTICEEYATDIESAPPAIGAYLREDSSCACSEQECLRLSRRGGGCVLKGGLCPSPLFCCSGAKRMEEEATQESVETSTEEQ